MIFNSDENYKVFLKSCQLNMHPPHLIITYQFQELKVSIFVDFEEKPIDTACTGPKVFWNENQRNIEYLQWTLQKTLFLGNLKHEWFESWSLFAKVVVSTILAIGIWRKNFSQKFYLPTIFQIYCLFSIFLRFVGCIIYSFLLACKRLQEYR